MSCCVTSSAACDGYDFPFRRGFRQARDDRRRASAPACRVHAPAQCAASLQQRRHGCCIVTSRAADRYTARPLRTRLRPAQQSGIGYQKSMFPALRKTLNTLLITQHPISNA
jgi:hypothetical protein